MKRSSLVLSLLAGLLVIATAFYLLRPSPGLPAVALRGLPQGVQGVVRVRVARVLASKPFQEIVVARGEARGMERVTKTCGFNPLTSVEEAFVSALPRAQGRDIVVSARGALDRTRLIDCVARYSGGSLASFQHGRVAGFDIMRNKNGKSSAAFVGREGLVVGDTPAVDALLRSLAGEAPNAERDPVLRELYAALAEDSEIALLARVPDDAPQRAALAALLPLPPGFPWAELRALTANVRLVDDRIRADLRLWMRDPTRARALARSIEEVRKQILALPGLGLLGVGAPLREARIEPSGKDLKLRMELRAGTVNKVIDMLPALAALQGALAGQAPEAARDAGAARDGGP